MMHPKYTRYLKQIVPFGMIWLLFAMVYSLLEYGLLGDLKTYPTTGNPYNYKENIIFTSSISFLLGLIQGALEILWLRKKFSSKKLWEKIVIKSMIHFCMIVLFLAVTVVLNGLLFESGDSGPMGDLKDFMGVFSFWSIIIYITVISIIAVFFSQISEYFGEGVLYNFFLGKYHTSVQEKRIFMFLDMKSSTTIAEEMGHEKYFSLLKDYYADMTNPILETFGEIYQYVGDEIVITWPVKKGVYRNNCIVCFDKIFRVFEKRAAHYLKKYDVVPAFKAGYHIGEVTSGEIGIIKRDIIYTGDVLNTTARIQAECNTYDAKALISQELVAQLPEESSFNFVRIGRLLLKGKKESVQLYSIEF